MNPVVKQMRAGILAIINQNPSIVKPRRRALAPDGFDGWVRTGAQSELAGVRVRVGNESSGVPGYAMNPAGIGDANSYFVITDHSLPLLEGDEIEAYGKKFTVGPIHEKRFAGQITGSDAKLEEVKA